MSIDLQLEFIEAVIHNLLHHRDLYHNADLFERRKLYDVIIYQCRHPEINAYIKRVVNNTRLLIEHVSPPLLYKLFSHSNLFLYQHIEFT